MKIYLLLALVMAVLYGCDGSHNPVDSVPEGTARIVRGYILDSESIDRISLIMHGDDTDYTAITYGDGNPNNRNGQDGMFQISDVPFGKYTITPLKDGYQFFPECIEIVVDDDMVTVPSMVGYIPPQTGHMIVCTYSSPQVDLQATLDISHYDRNSYKYIRSYGIGQAFIISVLDDSISTFTLRFTFYGDPFAEPIPPFKPDSIMVKLDEPVVCRDIVFTPREVPRYSLQGYISSIHNVEGLNISLQRAPDDVGVYESLVESDGFFKFSRVIGGRYTIEIGNGLFDISSDVDDMLTIDGNIDFAVLNIRYIGPMAVTLHGRVIDQDGIAIPGVTISRLNEIGIAVQQVLSDSDGSYGIPFIVEPGKTVTVRLRASKSGVEFTETFQPIPIVWEIDGMERNIDVDDLMGTNYSALTAKEFFPLDTVSRWTYRRTSGDETTDVDVTVSAIGDTWYRFTPRGPADFQEFSIGDGVVNVRDTSSMAGTLFRWGVSPGISWKVFPDQQYQVWNGKFIGLEEVTVPAGTYECAVFEAGIAWDSQSDTIYTLWFTRDIGLVKMTRISRSGGEEVEARTDELAEFIQ